MIVTQHPPSPQKQRVVSVYARMKRGSPRTYCDCQGDDDKRAKILE